MREFTVGEHTYRVERLSTFAQFHLARKLFEPLVFLGIVKRENKTADPHLFAQNLVANMDRLSKDDSEFILATCLGATQRRQAGAQAWASVQSTPGNLMFSDMSLDVCLQVVWHVIEDNGLLDFFATSPSASAPKETEGLTTIFPTTKIG